MGLLFGGRGWQCGHLATPAGRNLRRTSFLEGRTFLSVWSAERLSLSFRIFVSRAFVFLLSEPAKNSGENLCVLCLSKVNLFGQYKSTGWTC